MGWYIGKTLKDCSFDEAIEKVTTALKSEGFGVLTNIDMKATLKDKLNVDINKYKILGACNPPFAYKALKAEDKIGAMLPCNVVVKEKDNGEIEVAAINPIESMTAVKNEDLEAIAKEISQKLENVVNNLN